MASVLISNNGAEKSPLSSATFQRVFKLSLKVLRGSPEFAHFAQILGEPRRLEMHFCDDVEMRAFQRKFRKLNRTTDILSFPALEAPQFSEQHFLGSLAISLATVERNSRRYKRTLKLELLEVFIHGILHLLSFDHVRVSSSKKVRMRQLQAEIFQLARKQLP